MEIQIIEIISVHYKLEYEVFFIFMIFTTAVLDVTSEDCSDQMYLFT